MRSLLRLAAIGLFSLSLLAAALPAGAITGGTDDSPTDPEHPNVGLLFFYEPDGRFRCTATLISPTVLLTAAHFGMPVSTTHAITTNILGVGCAKSWRALNFPVISKILWAWVLTIPMTALMGWLAMKLWLFAGWPLK